MGTGRGVAGVQAEGRSREARAGGARVVLVQGDITTQEVDVIVNAANSSLMGGGGVDGAIHRAGGPQILEECKALVADRGALPAGEAVATTAGRLQARWVVHTVGPRWRGGTEGEDGTLAHAYRSSLELARDLGAGTVAFPSISTGAYGYPIDDAAQVALSAIRAELEEKPGSVSEVRLVLHDPHTLAAYERGLAAAFGD